MRAIILAGGMGIRLRPLTDNTPKPLLQVKGRPIIEHAILNFKRYGINDIVLCIGYRAEQIKAYFGDGKKFGVNITYCVENEPLGTGGAIRTAAQGIDETFIAINGDNLADFDWPAIIEEHKKNSAKLTLALYPVDDVTQYGIVRIVDGKIVDYVEKPSQEDAPSNLSNAGAYVFEPNALDILPEGRCSIEYDCFEKLATKNVVYAFIHKGQWFPTDTLEMYELADKGFRPPS
jgi:mannose-1-phosphate guanylyltransferase